MNVKESGLMLIVARAEVKKAQQLLELAIKAHYPLGASCQYKRSSPARWVNAHVYQHGYDGDVRIQLASGRLVWVRGASESNLTR